MNDPQDGPELPDDLVVTTTTDADVDVRKAYGMDDAAADEPAEKAAAKEKPAAAREAKADEGTDEEADAEADEDADDEEEPEVEAKPAAGAAPKKKESWRDRNARLSAEAHVLRVQRRELRAEVDALEAQKRATAPPAKAAEPAALKPRPRFDQFATTDEYETAMDTWDAERAAALSAQAADATRKELAAAAADTAKAAAIRVHGEQVASYNAQCADLRVQHADFDEVVTHNDALKISGLMEAAVLESDQGGAIAYWLGTHPEDAKEIAADTLGLIDESSKGDQIRKAISTTRRLLEKLVAAPDAVAKPAGPGVKPKPKSAPRPMSPAGGGAPASTVRDEDLDIDAYMLKRDREEAVQAGRL